MFYDPDTKILHGEQRPSVYHPNASLGEVLVHHLRKTPDRIAQVCAEEGTEVTCGELATMTVNFAKNLMKFGFKLGDVVGFVGRSCPHAIPTTFGCYLIGCKVNLLDSGLSVSEIVSVYQQTRPTIIFCDSDFHDYTKVIVDMLGGDVEIVTLTENLDGVRHVAEFFKDPESKFILPCNAFKASETVAIIARTSGAIDSPKLVQISHAQLLQTVALHGNDVNTFGLCFSSCSGVTSTFFTISAVVNHEKRLITKSQFSVDVCFDLLERYRITHFVTKTRNFRSLMESHRYQGDELSSLKTLVLTGFDVSRDLRDEIQQRLPQARIVVGGGMSEIAGIIYTSDHDDSETSALGKLSDNTQLKILLDDGSLGGCDEPGEVLIKRPENFLGYFNNSAATAKAIDSDGWFLTGDIGFFDESFNVTLIGRKSDIIRCEDHVLNPSEFEIEIRKVPGVQEAFVVGVPQAKLIELPAAVIVKDPESIVTTEMILESVKHLKFFEQLLGGVYFVDKSTLNDAKQRRRSVMRAIAINLFAKVKVESKES